MNAEQFKEKLDEAGLTKKDFANLYGFAVDTILKWIRINQTPSFVSVLLEWYIKAKKYEKIEPYELLQAAKADESEELTKKILLKQKLFRLKRKNQSLLEERAKFTELRKLFIENEKKALQSL